MSETICATCGTANGETRKFCGECGASLVPAPEACTACGIAYTAAEKFCGECGSPRPMSGSQAQSASMAAGGLSEGEPGSNVSGAGSASSGAELRLVSVLFVDLVGYTSLSETRDAEDMRDLLSAYFENARTIVARYGGTVEKFIGDAVMAVWGSPVAKEDDAERAVRAALDLVAAVPVFGAERGVVELQARAGVVTGQAAAIANASEGLVIGDRVNTAARVQGLAAPSTVLVDDVTRYATQAAVTYTDGGTHEVKGKTEPLRVWQANRVVAGVGGAKRVDGLEASFVGRDTELALIKALYHDALDRGTARLVTVVGQAGVGKSRLLWEFDKYTDGLADTVFWHKGRCLAYGDAVAYYALAEMVRQRFGIAEDDESATVRAKMLDGLGRYVVDPTAREFLIPRVGRLIGLDDGVGLSRDELFSGWRLLLEKLSVASPVVLVIEDVQWADTGLLDFVESLLDWSTQLPIFVLMLTRPELLDRRAAWGSGRRNATTVYLEPLPEAAVDRMLDDLVPGMPALVRDRITSQAEGIPLYAIETIRALIDQDHVIPREGIYTLVADLDDLAALEVPATLTSLIAARIDALPAPARSLVRELSVFPAGFTRAAAAEVTGRSDDEVNPLLAELVHRDVLSVRADPLSPEKGQFTFSQTLLRTVAHDTLSRRERQKLHLAAATHLRGAVPDDGDEMIDVIAAHYQDALSAGPEADASQTIRTLAGEAFVRSAVRAGRMGAPEAASRAYETAAEMSSDDSLAAGLLEQAASHMKRARLDEAVRLFQLAATRHLACGQIREAAAMEGFAAAAEAGPTSVTRLKETFAVLTDGPRDVLFAEMAQRLAMASYLNGDRDIGVLSLFEQALEVAEALELPDVISTSLIGKAGVLAARGRFREANALYTSALEVSLESGDNQRAAHAYGNLIDGLLGTDRPGLAEQAAAGLALARRMGDRISQQVLLSNLWLHQIWTGEWSAVEAACVDVIESGDDFPDVQARLALMLALRGDPASAVPLLDAFGGWVSDGDSQDQAIAAACLGTVSLAAGNAREALGALSPIVLDPPLGIPHETFRVAWPAAVEAALALGEYDACSRLLGVVGDRPRGHVPPYLRAQQERLGALVAAASGDTSDVESDFRGAIESLRSLGYVYWRARSELDLAEWLAGQGRHLDAQEPLASARAVFDRLGAASWSARATELVRGAGVAS